jgi:hypothetical protein
MEVGRGRGAEEVVVERTYWEGRGAGSRTAAVMIWACEERWEWERETGREGIMMWEVEERWEEGGWMMRTRGGEGVSSSSCSTFTVGAGRLVCGTGSGGGKAGALFTRHMVSFRPSWKLERWLRVCGGRGLQEVLFLALGGGDGAQCGPFFLAC